MKSLRALLCLVALSVLYATCAAGQTLTLEGLRSSAGKGSFKAAQYAPDGSLILLYDQGDGLRVLKTDATATNILTEAHEGTTGDAPVALALDPSGNIYVVGTSTSVALAGTAGVVFPSPADNTTNSFLAKFDSNLNLQCLTFLGAGQTVVSGVAATSDAVFVTGVTYSAALPVSSSAAQPAAAPGSTANGFLQRFSTDATTLTYSTYLTGSSGNTIPAAIAADNSDDAYITGQTTAAGFPTTASALQPRILGASSGFLSKLSPAGDGFVFSTFIAGTGLTSVAFDGPTNTLLLTGNAALGQFPVATVGGPIANTPYQSLLRLSQDGQTLLDSALLVPGSNSFVTAGPNGAAWISGSLGTPLWPASAQPASAFGDSFLLHLSQADTLDAAFRFGGLPIANASLASLTSSLAAAAISANGSTATVPGTLSASASDSVVANQWFDLPMTAVPTSALPNGVGDLLSAPCNTSQCIGSGGLLASVAIQPGTSTALSLSSGYLPNLTLRNAGPNAATGLVITATDFTVASNCGSTLAASGQCEIALTGAGPGSITISATNAPPLTIPLPANTQAPDALVLSTAELDFGIVTSSSPQTRTVTLTNLTNTPQSFTSGIDAGPSTPPYNLAEVATTCGQTGGAHLIPASSSCTVTLALTASSSSTDDSAVWAFWKLGPRDVAITGLTQAASLTASVAEIDFGVHFAGLTPQLPRYLYLSNASADAVQHTAVSLPASSPFAVTDRCPSTLAGGAVCQIEITYNQSAAQSDDSATLTLDQGLTALITGATLPAAAATGAGADPSVVISPGSLSFTNPVVVTQVSSEIHAVTVTNSGTNAVPLTVTMNGDFLLTNNCGTVVAPSSTCLLLLQFVPAQPGLREGLLTISAGPAFTPTYVSLTATASPLLVANNGALNLGSTYVGEPEISWYRIQSPVPNLTASVAGGLFGVALVPDNAGSPAPISNAAFTSTVTAACPDCWLAIQFLPQATGPASTALTLSTSSGGNSYQLSVTAQGLTVQGLVLTAASQDFGSVPVGSSSAPVTFTLANLLTPAAPVSIQSVSATGDFTVLPNTTGGPSCTGALASTASCYLQVSFVPAAAGTSSGTLIVTTSNGVATAALSGSASPRNALTITPAAITFTNQPGTAATQASITLSNSSQTPLSIGTITSSSTSFAVTTGCSTLAPGLACTANVTFTPGTANTSGTISIPASSIPAGQTATTLYSVPVTGAYTSSGVALVLLPGEAVFGAQTTGTLGQTRQFTLLNTSSETQTISVDAPQHFPLSTPFGCATLTAGASCTFSATFLPEASGALTGSIVVSATSAAGIQSQAIAYLQGYGIGGGNLSLSGTQLAGLPIDFGQVTSGQAVTQTVTLTNTGSGTLNVRRIVTAPPFADTITCGQPLAPGASCTATVTYAPVDETAATATSTVARPDTGTLTIESDAVSSPDVLDLTGTVLPVIAASPSDAAVLASYTLSEGALTFPNTLPGSISAPQILTLTNNGTTTLSFGPVVLSPEFAASSTCATLQPAQSCEIAVTFSPSAGDTNSARAGTLEISSNALNALEFVSLLGLSSSDALTASSTALNFGTVDVGTSDQLAVTLTNSAPLPIAFGQVAITSDYSISSTTCPAAGAPLPAGQSCTLIVTFTATTPGASSGSLTLTTNASATPLTLSLSGVSIAPQLQATPSTLAFGNVTTGSSAALSLSLSNVGATALTDVAASISGPDAEDFTIATPCSPSTLSPSSSCAVQIGFTPSAVGTRSATLALISSDPFGTTTISLTGTGTQPSSFVLAANGGSSATATATFATTASYALTLTPISGYTGPVALTCTPVVAAPNALCSVANSRLTLSGAALSSTATITTGTELSNVGYSASGLLVLGPALLYVRRRRRARLQTLCAAAIYAVATTFVLSASGCGGPGATGQAITPPGTYQYQVTATSTTGPPMTSTVTLNLIVQ